MSNVAVLGTGRLGAPAARRLASTGHRVVTWNRTPSRTAAPDIRAAASVAEAVRDAEIVLVVVTDAAAVHAVLTGPGGVGRALRPGTVVVQMSTIGPDEVRAVARALPDGVALVDAPVAGSTDAAENGTLLVLAGGPDPAIDRAGPVLSSLGTVRRCGGLGAGAALKLVLNTALVTGIAALADTLAVAHAVGVDRDTALDVLRTGVLARAVERGTAPGRSFSVALAGKDLDLALSALGPAPAPVARAAAGVLRTAPDRTADIASLLPQEHS